MNVSPNELRRQTVQTLKEIDEMLAMNQRAFNSPTRAALLQGKAQCLHTLTLLQDSGKKK